MTATAEAYLDQRQHATAAELRASARSWLQAYPWLGVVALTGIGLAIRLIQVRGIWVDEAISIHQAHMSLPAMLANLRTTDNHPPLFFLALWATVRWLGNSEEAVRVPSLIAGTLLIPALFLTGRELFDRRTGLLAAAFASVAPIMVWYAQESRPYAMFMLFATLSVWAQVCAVRDGRARYWVAYGAFTIALLYTHYFSIIPIGIQQLAFGAVAWHRARHGQPVRPLLIGCWLTWIAIVVALAPLAPFIHQQFLHDQTAGTGFSSTPSAGEASASSSAPTHIGVYSLIANFVWALWGYHANATMLRVAALWPLLMLLALALLGRGRSRASMLVLALAVLPVFALMAVAGAKHGPDLFEVRYFSGAVPMLILLCARTVVTASRRRLPVLLIAGALLVTMIVGTADQQLAKSNPRNYDFRSALETVRQRVRPGDTLMYAPDYLRDVIEYYAPHVHTEVLRSGKPMVPASGRIFVLGSFLDQPGVPSALGTAKYALVHAHRRLVATDRLQRIYLWEYR